MGPKVYAQAQEDSLVIYASIGLIAAILLVVGVILGIRAFLRSPAGQLTKAFFRAKKQRVCPIIQIEGLPEPQKPAEATQ
jgi:hypothetical protein